MNLIELFGIPRKKVWIGWIKILIILIYRKTYVTKFTSNITAKNIIIEIMNRFNATNEHQKAEVIKLYEQIKNTSHHILIDQDLNQLQVD